MTKDFNLPNGAEIEFPVYIRVGEGQEHQVGSFSVKSGERPFEALAEFLEELSVHMYQNDSFYSDPTIEL